MNEDPRYVVRGVARLSEQFFVEKARLLDNLDLTQFSQVGMIKQENPELEGVVYFRHSSLESAALRIERNRGDSEDVKETAYRELILHGTLVREALTYTELDERELQFTPSGMPILSEEPKNKFLKMYKLERKVFCNSDHILSSSRKSDPRFIDLMEKASIVICNGLVSRDWDVITKLSTAAGIGGEFAYETLAMQRQRYIFEDKSKN